MRALIERDRPPKMMPSQADQLRRLFNPPPGESEATDDGPAGASW
jgi:hypothetical protein